MTEPTVLMIGKDLPPDLRKSIRKTLGLSGKPYPIFVIEGDFYPRFVGESWHYRNASGDLIHFPNAYRRAWGKPIYVASTLRIEISATWLMSQFPPVKTKVDWRPAETIPEDSYSL